MTSKYSQPQGPPPSSSSLPFLVLPCPLLIPSPFLPFVLWFFSDDDADVLLLPPDNFSQLSHGLYRSGFPTKKNFPFLRQLRLRSLVYLCPEEYPPSHLTFLSSCHTALHQYPLQGNKEPFIDIPPHLMTAALIHLLTPSSLPLLIHCNKGKHRTGCLVGVYRRTCGWSLASVFEEYRRFSEPKERQMDQQFIELFDTSEAVEEAKKREREDRKKRQVTGGGGGGGMGGPLDTAMTRGNSLP